MLMIGGQVNETSGGNVCPRPGFPADVCKAAPAASGGGAGGELGSWGIGDVIAVDLKETESDADDILYVGDQERIQAFDSDGVYQSEIALPGRTVQSLATDTAGDLYAIYLGQSDVRKIESAGGKELVKPRFALTDPDGKVVQPTAVAVDVEGSVYAFGPTLFQAGRPMDPIFKFDPTGNEIERFGKGEFNGSTGLEANLCPGNEPPGNLYVSNTNGSTFVRAYGTPPTNCGQAVTGAASDIAETAATLNGRVNPKGEALTECRFEYGLTETYGSVVPCVETPGQIGEGSDFVPVHAEISGLQAGTVYHFRLVIATAEVSEAGSDESFKTLGPPVISDEHTVSATFTEATVAARVNPEGLATTYRFEYGPDTSYGSSTPETPIGEDRNEHAVQAVLKGLTPGETYHWRVVATNQSDSTAGEDRIATTYQPVTPATACPNQPLRSGAAALLPDCRAFEMVSPVDKNGSDIVSKIEGASSPGGFVQASTDGQRITYAATAIFAGQPAGFLFSQYLGTREAGEGWSTEGIHPPVTGTPVDSVLFGQHRDFMAFTPDPRFEAEIYPLSLAGEQDAEDGIEFSLFQRAVGCSTAHFDAQLGTAAKQLLLGAQFGGCTTTPGELFTTVDMKSCSFVPSVANSGPPYSGSLAISCTNPEDKVELTGYTSEGGEKRCIWQIPAQSLDGTVAYENRGAGASRHLTATIAATGIDATRKNLCLLDGKGSTTSTGSLSGTLTLRGTE